MARHKRHVADGPRQGDTYEQVTGRHRGRIVEIDKGLGLSRSARNHVARTPGTAHAERVRRRRNYFLATAVHPEHMVGRVIRVSEKTLETKYRIIPNASRSLHARLDAATASA